MDDPSSEDLMVSVEGTHLVLDKSIAMSNMNKGLLLPETEDGRVMFILPWHQSLLLGTTEYKYE
jgi:glycerol-3-phosphate dehydrogenase